MNKFDFIIRKETANDYREIENIAREAFWNLSVPGCTEHYFIHTMRSHEAFIPELDYVLEVNSRVVGCVMYTKAALEDENGLLKPVLSMGPICIHPDFQRMGGSRRLLEFTFDKARQLGYDVFITSAIPTTTSPAATRAARNSISVSREMFSRLPCSSRSSVKALSTAESGYTAPMTPMHHVTMPTPSRSSTGSSRLRSRHGSQVRRNSTSTATPL